MDKRDFNAGWKFGKQGDSERQTITLPHDAMIHETRGPNNPSGAAGAYFPGGVYVYEKDFHVPVEWAEKSLWFEFEGVYQNAKVYLNDREAGGHPYGYIPFTVDADEYLQYGAENTIRVVVDNSQLPNSRWYTGSGIYRPVWMYLAEKAHINHQGVKVSTLSYSPARIRVDTAHNGGEAARALVEILDGGKIVARGEGNRVELDIPSARLWNEDAPELYHCRVTLEIGGKAIDQMMETFGIRKVEWSAKGLFINGKNTLLRGGCIHHDNGILGACSFAKSEERRVRIMKQAGYNAIRSSHNPASKAMLAACDKYGVYMIDETWDLWYSHKSKHDYASSFMENYRYDIQAMVERDFNHPSVIMYSICNEISEPKDEKGVALGQEMVSYIHSMDENRAVTGGVNLFLIEKAAKGKGIYKEDGGRADEKEGVQKKKASGSLMFNIIASMVGTGMNKAANSDSADKATTPFLDSLDIAGYNYASGRYPLEGAKHPDRVLFGSETFPQDIAKNWAMVKQYPYLVGDFMWTGWDYIGEAGMGSWNYHGEGGFEKSYPWLLADGGAIDILGTVGAEAEYAATVWGLRSTPYIGVRPVNHAGDRLTKAVWRGTNAIASWAWQGCEGNRAEIEVYSNATRVELLLNGKRIGNKRAKAYMAKFRAKYTPGVLEAVAYDANGRETGRAKLNSATEKTRIRVQPEENEIAVGDILYVDVSLVGENGVVECNADTRLTVEVEGADLLAFGSANPRTEEQYDSGSFIPWYGRALAVVRGTRPGTVTLRVSAKDISATESRFTVVNK